MQPLKKECVICGVDFLTIYIRRIYCSEKCKRKNCYKKVIPTKKRCVLCNNWFITSYEPHIYCSKECRNRNNYIKSYKKRVILTKKKCKICNKEFMPSQRHQKYCSRKCGSQSGNLNKWKILGISEEEYKQFISKCFFCEWKFNIEKHHILPIMQGGKEELTNLLPLCPNHHSLIQSRGLVIEYL